MKNEECIFILDFPEAESFLRMVIIICNEVQKHQAAQAEPTPAKFGLGRECADQMLSLGSVGPVPFRAMLDVIGGHYAAVALGYRKQLLSFEEYMHAVELMKFAKSLEHKAPREWKIKMVRP